MKLLAVTPYYPPDGGGLERYAAETLSRLAEGGHDVRVLTFSDGETDNEQQDGVEVERLDPLLRLGNTPLHPTFPLHVDRRIDADAPDVVLAHTPVPFPAEAAYLATARHGTPFVVTYHAGQLTGGTPLLDGLATADRLTVQRGMLAGADRLIAVSPYVRDTALAPHEDRTTVIAPGVDADRFRPGEGQRDPVILFVGPVDSTYRWKGLDVLLEALPHVLDRCPDARLEVIGDGDRLDTLGSSNGDGRHPVRFRGRVSDEALVEAYQRAAVTVLPSTSDAESFGMVLAEANACGCPVVGSEIGGIPSFIRDGENGHLARPGDPQDLAAAIVSLLEDPDRARRMGQRGREIVRREHDWDEVAERTEAVLLDAAEGTSPLGSTADGAGGLDGQGQLEREGPPA